MNESMSITAPVTIPVWAVAAIALGLFFAVLWAALPVLMRRTNPRWPFATPEQNLVLSIIVVLGVLLFLGAVLSAFAVLLHTFQTASRSGDGPNLGAGALIAALLGAPFVIWGTVLKWQTVRYQKEGHMTDRISKAVEQLGAEKTVKKDGKEETVPNLEVRMGAILSLERIAQDSTMHDKGRDHVMVMQILCEYIRENSNARKPQEHDLGEWEPLQEGATAQERKAHEVKRNKRFYNYGGPIVLQWAENLQEPRADIQLALKVIGRRSGMQRRVEAAWPERPTRATYWPFEPAFAALPISRDGEAIAIEQIELFKTGLETWKKSCRQYKGYRFDLRGANLQGVKLEATQPDGSDMVFSGVRLDGARLEGANLEEVRLEGASFDHAHLEGAHLAYARLAGATFNEAWMECANFCEARMEGASLNFSNMASTSLSGARLEGAIIFGAQLEGASITAASLEGADLWQTNFSDADICGTDLFGTKSLTTEQLITCFGDGSVILPVGVRTPMHWPKKRLLPDHYEAELRRWRASPSTYTPPE